MLRFLELVEKNKNYYGVKLLMPIVKIFSGTYFASNPVKCHPGIVGFLRHNYEIRCVVLIYIFQFYRNKFKK